MSRFSSKQHLFRAPSHVWAVSVFVVLTIASWLLREGFPPWSAFPGEILAVVGLLALSLGLADAATRSQVQFDRWVLAGGLAAFAHLAYSVFARHQTLGGDAAVVALNLLAFLVAYHVGLAYRAHSGRDHLFAGLLGLFVMGGLMVSFINLVQILQITDAYSWVQNTGASGARASANFGQANHAGTVLAVGVISLWVMYLTGRVRLAVLLFAFPVLVLGLVQTDSRTAFLGVTFSLVLILLRWPGLTPEIAGAVRMKCWYGLGLWLLAYWLLRSMPLQVWVLGDLAPLVVPRALLVEPVRIGMWTQMLQGSLVHPWLGWGWLNTVGAQYEGYLAHCFAETVAGSSFSHNLFLDLVVWTGWVLGPLLSAGLIALLARPLFRASSPAQLASIVMVMPFALHCMLEYPFAYLYLMVPFAILLGFGQPISRSARFVGVSYQAVVCFAVAGFAVLGAVSFDYLRYEDYIRRWRFEDRRIITQEPIPAEPYTLFSQLRLFSQQLQIKDLSRLTPQQFDMIKTTRVRYPGAAYQARYIAALLHRGDLAAAQVEAQKFQSIFGAAYVRQLFEFLETEGLQASSLQLRPCAG